MDEHDPHSEHDAPPRPPLPPDATLWQRFRYHARPSIALGIVAVSMLGAVMAYRASLAEEEGSRATNLSGQQEIQREAALLTDNGLVDQDLRVFGRIQEHLLLSEQLRKEARKASGNKAHRLVVDAQQELALARAEQSFLQGAGFDATRGKPTYDAGLARRQAIASDQDLQRLVPEELGKEANATHLRVVKLVGLAAGFIVALFFLTLGEANVGALRRTFVAIGATVAVAAAITAAFV